MKKKVLIVLLAVLLGMTMILTACKGSGSDTASESDASSENSETTEAVEKPMTFEDYVAGDPEVQEAIANSMSNNNYLIDIVDNSIIYTIDLANIEGYTEENVRSEEIVEGLHDSLDENAGKYGDLAKGEEYSSGVSGITVVVNYTWGDEIIVTKTFTSADAASED